MAARLKFGWIRGGKTSFVLPMGASEQLYAKSGRFVTNDASGRGEVAGAASTALQGFVEGATQTCSSTEGGTKLNCIIDTTAIFRVPLAYDGSAYTVNYSSALLGELCDLVTIDGTQYVNPTAVTNENVRIVGGKAMSTAGTAAMLAGIVTGTEGLCLGDGYVDVMINPTELYEVAVGA